MIEKGCDVNHPGHTDKPALLWVAAHVELKDHDYLLHQLVDAGANVDARDNNGDTALIISSMNGHENCVKALLEKKANPNLMNYRRQSALFVAAMNGHTGIAKDLLNAGADMDVKSSDNLSAYEIAKRNGRRHIYDMMDKIRSEKELKKEEL